MRRKRHNNPDAYGGLAGWLFADVALVLALAFLSSQVVGEVPAEGEPEVDEPSGPVVPESPEETPGLEQIDGTGAVDVKEIELSRVCVGESQLGSLAEVATRVEDKLVELNVPEDSSFGVVLVYAGYREVQPTDSLEVRQANAKARAAQFRDTIREWSRLSKERWVKDLGHDGGTDFGCYKLYLLRELR